MQRPRNGFGIISGTGWLRVLLWALLCCAHNLQAVPPPPLAAQLQQLKQLKQQAEQSPPAPVSQFQQLLRQDPLGQPQLSPDGQWLAYWRREGSQYWLCRSRGDGEEQVLHKQRQPPEPVLSFSADGSRLWLAAADQLRVLTLRRPAQLRTLWQAGAGLPGLPVQSRHWPIRLVQWSSSGSGYAVFAAQLAAPQANHDGSNTGLHRQWHYWSLGPDSTARTLWQSPLPLADLRLDSEGKPLALLAFTGADYQLQLWQQSPAGLVPTTLCAVLAQCVLHQVQPDGSLWLSRFELSSRRHQLWWYPPATPQQQDSPTTRSAAAQLQYSTADEFDAVLTTTTATSTGLPAQPRLLAVRHRVGWQGVAAGWQALLAPLQADQSRLTLQLASAATAKAGATSWLLVSRQRSDRPLTQQLRLQLRSTSPATTVSVDSLQPLQLRGRSGAAAAATVAVPAPWLHFSAADGLKLPFRLWLPPGRPLQHSPLLLLLHGGPFGQLPVGFQPEIPLLLQQGVIVLQLAYRSSSGFGLPLQLAAGIPFDSDAVLADLPALLDSLLAAGIGDPQQQAIVGHSFGGHLALQARQRWPERFRFVLAQAAPVDVSTTLQQYLPKADLQQGHSLRPLSLELKARGLELQTRGVGVRRPDTARHHRQQAAPAASQSLPPAGTPPLYLWGGLQDERVLPASLRQYQQQLRQQGQPVRLWLDPAAGHQPAAGLSEQSWLLLLAQRSQQHLRAAAAGATSGFAQQGPMRSRPDDSDTDALEAYLQQIEVSPPTN